jgi:hypothetical protein
MLATRKDYAGFQKGRSKIAKELSSDCRAQPHQEALRDCHGNGIYETSTETPRHASGLSAKQIML